jgi:DNA-binding CsgD family transcriptional regulator
MKRPAAIPGYVVDAINKAESLQALHDVVSRHLDDIGFSRFAFHLVRAADYSDRILTVLTDYPDEWIRRYTDQSYLYKDAVHNQALHTMAPFEWSSLRKKDDAKQAGLIFDEAAEFHLKDGLSIPTRGMNQTFSVFSAVADGTESERAEAIKLNGATVALLAPLIHETAGKLVKSDAMPIGDASALTAREREVMKWVASGKISADIAEILKIGEATVNAHVQAAAEKLNATTRTHAAVLAVLAGIVDPA